MSLAFLPFGPSAIEKDANASIGYRIGDDTGTAGSISVGQSLSGSDQHIDYGGDEDWYAINLSNNQSLQIALYGSDSGAGGGTLSDTILKVYDRFGNLVAENDDAGGTLNSALNFVATYTGVYYISAGGFGSITGSYTLDVDAGNFVYNPNDSWEFAPAVSGALLDSVRWGTRHDSKSLSVYFLTAGESAGGFTSEGWTTHERAQVQKAFDAIEAVSGLRFTITNRQQGADLEMVLDTDELGNDLYGQFNPPGFGGDGNDGVGVFNGALWDRTGNGDLQVGGFGYLTMMHEILHGLGLAHPHDDGGDSSILPGVSSERDDFGNFDLNQGVYSVMSYNPGFHTGTLGSAPVSGTGDGSGVRYGFAAGPMAVDIAMLQALYGANTTHNAGASSYVLPVGNTSGTYWSTIWDSGGVDNIRYAGTRDVTIDLRSATLDLQSGGGGHVSAVNGVRGGFTIARGAVIENAYGGDGNDAIQGNIFGNQIVGLDGRDTINGGGGDDILVGALGDDSVLGSLGDDSILGNAGIDTLRGGDGNDLIASDFDADLVFGDNGNDLINAGGNDAGTIDRIFGGNGNDTVFGVNGQDYIDGGEGDDALYGGNQVDEVLGRNGNDTISGGAGIDTLRGGGGDDSIVGGTSTDWMYGDTGQDTLSGQGGNDRLFGGGNNDLLLGQGNNDTIRGGNGFDTIDGGTGNDVLRGDEYGDTFVFVGTGHGHDRIIDFNDTLMSERIDLRNLGTVNTWEQVDDRIAVSGNDIIITTSAASSITLLNVQRADLGAADFIF